MSALPSLAIRRRWAREGLWVGGGLDIGLAGVEVSFMGFAHMAEARDEGSWGHDFVSLCTSHLHTLAAML